MLTYQYDKAMKSSGQQEEVNTVFASSHEHIKIITKLQNNHHLKSTEI